MHSKLTLITKKGPQGYSYITQIGTGNYNEKTSELYTDYSFITADHGIGEEASLSLIHIFSSNSVPGTGSPTIS